MMRVPLMSGIAALVAVTIVFPSQAALVVHYDASDGSSVLNTGAAPASSGEVVGTWRDLAGGDQNGAPTSGSPIFNQNGGPLGKPAISFPGANIVSGAPTQARTVMMVHRWGPGGRGPAYLLDGRGGIGNSYVWEGGIGGNWTAYVNDSTTSTGSVASLRSDTWQVTTLVGSSTGTDDVHLHSRYTNNEFGFGSMAEVRIFDTVLTESQRLAQVAELDAKWFTGAPPANLPQLITPTTATSSTAGAPNPDFYPVSQLVDDSGFSGPVDIYNYPGVPHSNSGSTMWVTDNPNGTGDYYLPSSPGLDPVLTFDLPDLFELTDMVAWNYDVIGNAAKEFTIEFSTDGGGSFGGAVPGLIIPAARTAAHTISLPGGPHLADAVRLTITDNWLEAGAGGDRVGLGEIKFIGTTPGALAVPEPSTFVLAALGLLGLGLVGRRRKRTA